MVKLGKHYPNWNPSRLICEWEGNPDDYLGTEYQWFTGHTVGPALLGQPSSGRGCFPTYPLDGTTVHLPLTLPSNVGFLVQCDWSITWDNSLSGLMLGWNCYVNFVNAFTLTFTTPRPALPFFSWAINCNPGAGQVTAGPAASLIGDFFTANLEVCLWALSPPHTSPF